MSLKGIRKKDNPDYVQRKNVNGSTYYKKRDDPNRDTTMKDNLDDYATLLEYDFSNEDYEVIDHIEEDMDDPEYDDTYNDYDDTDTKTFDSVSEEEYYDYPEEYDHVGEPIVEEYDNNREYEDDEIPKRTPSVKQRVINFFDKYKYPIMIGIGSAAAIGAVGVGIYAITNFIVVS